MDGRVLDSDPNSANYSLKFVDKSLLPDAYVNGTMDGRFVGQHSADFLRTAALWQHGGVWIDVGCITVRNMDQICWKLLEDSNTPFQVAVPHTFEAACSHLCFMLLG
jgi:hypothetical protein